jgi:hypothetical protein
MDIWPVLWDSHVVCCPHNHAFVYHQCVRGDEMGQNRIGKKLSHCNLHVTLHVGIKEDDKALGVGTNKCSVYC